MKPSNPGEKSFLTTKKKGNVIINPKKEDLMKETKLDEKKLDAVGKEDKDIDNDGDHDKSDKYLLNRRKVRSKVIKMREAAYDALRAKRAKKPQGEGAVDTAPDESNVGESVEQIDELSSATLKSYIKKRKEKIAKGKQGLDRAIDQAAEKDTIGKTVKKPKGTYDIKNYKEEVENITEISANKLIDAAKAAEVKRGKAAVAGDRETAKKAIKQNKKFFDAAQEKRKNESIDRMKARMIQFTKDHDNQMSGKQPI